MIKITGIRMPKNLQTKSNTSRQIVWKDSEEAVIETALVLKHLIGLDPLLATTALSVAAKSLDTNRPVESVAKEHFYKMATDMASVIRTPQKSCKEAVRPQDKINGDLDACRLIWRRAFVTYVTGKPEEQS